MKFSIAKPQPSSNRIWIELMYVAIHGWETLHLFEQE